MSTTAAPSARRLGRWAETLGVFAGYSLVAIAFTWPLARDPSHLGVLNPDYYINTWVLAWDVH